MNSIQLNLNLELMEKNLKSVDNQLDYFNSQYKFILQKSNEALITEANGNISQAYALFKNIISDVDNLLGMNVCNTLNRSNEEMLKKRDNLNSLRNNICDCIERIKQKNDSNALLLSELVYSIKSECQYTKIGPDGSFDVPSYPGLLEIYKFPPTPDGEQGFIMVSDWVAPLIQHVTPILITPEGALIFYDTENEKDSRVVVTLPFNVTQEEFQRCLSVLHTLALIVVDTEEMSKKSIQTDNKAIQTTGEYISSGLNRVSHTVSKGVVVGASKLGQFVTWGSDEICQRINPGQAELNPNVKTGLEYARRGSHKMIEISGKAFRALSTATQYVASKAAPHIVSTANNVIPNEWKEKGQNGEISKADQIALVTGSGLQGLALLFDSLHEAAVSFGRCATRSSAKVMTHRYGEEIGKSTENAMYAAGNLGMTAFVALHFTKKGILKTAAKMTAIEVADKYRKDNSKIEPVNTVKNHDLFENNDKHI